MSRSKNAEAVDQSEEVGSAQRSPLVRAFGALDVSDLVLCSRIEGLKPSEMASVLGVPKSSVWSRIKKITGLLTREAEASGMPPVQPIAECVKGRFRLSSQGKQFADLAERQVKLLESQLAGGAG